MSILRSGRAEPDKHMKMQFMVEARDSIKWTEEQEGGRLLNTHIHLSFLPQAVFQVRGGENLFNTHIHLSFLPQAVFQVRGGGVFSTHIYTSAAPLPQAVFQVRAPYYRDGGGCSAHIYTSASCPRQCFRYGEGGSLLNSHIHLSCPRQCSRYRRALRDPGQALFRVE